MRCSSAVRLLFMVLSALSLVPSIGLAQLSATALPTGGEIVSGQGNISSSGSEMTIQQNTNKLIAEWNTFDIGQEASVQFIQPSSSSIALNRVLSMDASQIFGNLSANGQIFLINPAGVTFGASARFSGAGFLASTLDISNNDFLNGNFTFDSSGQVGTINNAGLLNADGGYIAFLAPYIDNSGTVQADDGSVTLIAADEVSLDFAGDGLINYTIAQGAIDAQINNSGLIQADNGAVVMTAEAKSQLTQSVVNNSGIVRAQGVSAEGGRILLVAEGGNLNVSGVLDASSFAAQGGSVIATGDEVIIAGNAHLTSNGATGGGEVLVGGSWQNSDESVYQATTTIVEKGAVLEASATDNGDGGTIVAWSDIHNQNSVTSVNATLKAEAIGLGKTGGQIETSGHKVTIGDNTRVITLSEQGDAGLWLIDPKDYTIAASGGDITGATLSTNLGSGNVSILSTAGATDGSGDINVNDAVSWSANNLSLTAERDININATMTASGNSTLTMIADNNSGDNLDPFTDGYTADQIRAALATIGRVRVGLNNDDTGFAGKVEFGSRTGTGILTINGEDYNIVSSLADIDAIADLDNAGQRIALGTDINASGTSVDQSFFFKTSTVTSYFRGIFDGLGHTIDSFTSTGSEACFFGRTRLGAVIRNIGFTNHSITSSSANRGIFTSYSWGLTLHNSFAEGQIVTTANDFTGGLISFLRTMGSDSSNSLIENVYTNVAINMSGGSPEYGGGLIGYAQAYEYPIILSNTHATGTVDFVGGVEMGGLIGEAYGQANPITILDSYATGTINASSPSAVDGYIGGLIGVALGEVNLDTVFAEVDVYGNNRVGGLIGKAAVQTATYPLVINAAYASGDVYGYDSDPLDKVGGFIGEIDAGLYVTISDSFAYGNVTNTTNHSGGLFGRVNADPSLTNVYWNSTTNTAAVGTSSPAITGATGLTNTNFATQGDIAGFDFTNDWYYPIGGNAYPLLRAFMVPTPLNIITTPSTPSIPNTSSLLAGAIQSIGIVSGSVSLTESFDPDTIFGSDKTTEQAAGAGGSDENLNLVSGQLVIQGNEVSGIGSLSESVDPDTVIGSDKTTEQAAGAGGSDENLNLVSGELGNQGNEKDVGNAGGSKGVTSKDQTTTSISGDEDASSLQDSSGKEAGAGGSDENKNTVSGESGNQGNEKDVGNAGGDKSSQGGADKTTPDSDGKKDKGDKGKPETTEPADSEVTEPGESGNQGNEKDVGNAGGSKGVTSKDQTTTSISGDEDASSTQESIGKEVEYREGFDEQTSLLNKLIRNKKTDAQVRKYAKNKIKEIKAAKKTSVKRSNLLKTQQKLEVKSKDINNRLKAFANKKNPSRVEKNTNKRDKRWKAGVEKQIGFVKSRLSKLKTKLKPEPDQIIVSREGEVLVLTKLKRATGFAILSEVTETSSVAVIVYRPDKPPVEEKGFSVTQKDGQIKLRPIDKFVESFGSPGDVDSIRDFSVESAAGVAELFTVSTTTVGIVIKPKSDTAARLSEEQRALVIGTALTEVQEYFDMSAKEVGTIYVDLRDANL